MDSLAKTVEERVCAGMMQSVRLSWKTLIAIGLVYYLAMGVGIALGWWCHVWIYDRPMPPATSGLAVNILGCFAFAWTVLLVGPLMVSAWISCLLFPPGFGGILWLLFVLALAAAQYALLFCAVRDIFRRRTRLKHYSCGIFLAAYSFLYSFALLYVGSII